MGSQGKKPLKVVAAGRILIGTSVLVAPRVAARGWLGDVSESRGGQAAVRMVGVRDLVLGLGTLSALQADDPRAHSWVDAGILADLIDAGAAYLARAELPSPQRYFVYAAAGGAALTGALFRGSAKP